MIPEYLSLDWMRDYRDAWNARPDIVAGLAGFDAWIEYGWAGGERPSTYLRVDDGRAVEATDIAPEKTDFVMHASPENWLKIYTGELNGRAALLTRKLQFRGSMITAMRYMTPFNASIALIGKIPAVWPHKPS